MPQNPNFEIVLAINKHVAEVKKATTQLHGPSSIRIKPTECAERIIESAMALQEMLDTIQEQNALS